MRYLLYLLTDNKLIAKFLVIFDILREKKFSSNEIARYVESLIIIDRAQFFATQRLAFGHPNEDWGHSLYETL